MRFSSLDAAPAECRARWRTRASISSASIAPRRCSPAQLRNQLPSYPITKLPNLSVSSAETSARSPSLRERDLWAALQAVARVLQPGATFGIELVADLPSWDEYKKRVSLSGWRGGRRGAHVTLVEAVRQDRERRLTIFDQQFIERRGARRRTHAFSLSFRTLSVPQMTRRLEKAGFEISALLGDYRGGPWDPRADVWMILARRC